jgi:hypothetical protein
MPECWDYPGSRWWKFDFHTHAPAAKDTGYRPVQNLQLTREEWLPRHLAVRLPAHAHNEPITAMDDIEQAACGRPGRAQGRPDI